jgi:hypothetical protein
MKYWESSLTSLAPLAGHGAIVAPLPEMVGVGLLTLIAKVAATFVQSDELLSAFVELERVT